LFLSVELAEIPFVFHRISIDEQKKLNKLCDFVEIDFFSYNNWHKPMEMSDHGKAGKQGFRPLYHNLWTTDYR